MLRNDILPASLSHAISLRDVAELRNLHMNAVYFMSSYFSLRNYSLDWVISNKKEKVILLYVLSEKRLSIFPVDSLKLVKNNNFLVNKHTREARDQAVVDVSFPEYSGFRAKFRWDELWNMRTHLIVSC